MKRTDGGTRGLSARRLLMPWGLAALLLAVAVCAALAQDLHKRTAKVKREIAKQAAAHAALRGAKGELPKGNSLCLLCHANFASEELVTAHLQDGVTCAVCHGLSYEHMNDETSRTKPDLLFGRAQVGRFCRRCHTAHQDPDRVSAFLAEWKGKTRPNGRLILQQAVCTDCHGTHALRAVPVATKGPGE